MQVSILTRPEGRVQPKIASARLLSVSPFQSSPVPRDGCNFPKLPVGIGINQFQSSPVPRDGCNLIIIRAGRAG